MKFSRRKLLKRYGIYFFPILAVLVVVLVSFYVLLPKINEIITNQDQISQKQDQEADLVQKRKLLESIESGQTVTSLSDAESALPSDKDAASILTALQNLSAETGVAITSLSLSPGIVSTESGAKESESTQAAAESRETLSTTQHKGVDALEVKVNVIGTTQQFTDFITRLLKSRRIFDIEKVSVAFFVQEEGFVEADFSLFAYFLLPITKLGSVEQKLPPITDAEKKVLSQLSSMPYISQSLTSSIPYEGQTGKKDLFTP